MSILGPCPKCACQLVVDFHEVCCRACNWRHAERIDDEPLYDAKPRKQPASKTLKRVWAFLKKAQGILQKEGEEGVKRAQLRRAFALTTKERDEDFDAFWWIKNEIELAVVKAFPPRSTWTEELAANYPELIYDEQLCGNAIDELGTELRGPKDLENLLRDPNSLKLRIEQLRGVEFPPLGFLFFDHSPADADNDFADRRARIAQIQLGLRDSRFKPVRKALRAMLHAFQTEYNPDVEKSAQAVDRHRIALIKKHLKRIDGLIAPELVEDRDIELDLKARPETFMDASWLSEPIRD